ncbi:hypothetical protein AAN93_005041 [Salmonella enterica subsp. enterica]|nr:hypothetical protein [Salmonella enterica]EDD5837939.1 hypothetical protein [Salmonella enterica subsp. enterica serovar Enteritidis]EDR2901239.1 hypothetical protein [Salmonella enterica subsp. enterica serovar Amherstiana]EDR4320141.1 hypothetical protein [Salmonella enterica subsp. enterica serovar Berta]EDR6290186.1 hypothetical protein [Salmonella enterica subsp. enterica serovar Pensacola]
MDRIAQQNAPLMEESAAAALEEQVSSLTQVIAVCSAFSNINSVRVTLLGQNLYRPTLPRKAAVRVA